MKFQKDEVIGSHVTNVNIPWNVRPNEKLKHYLIPLSFHFKVRSHLVLDTLV
jgi:hypothetical protein